MVFFLVWRDAGVLLAPHGEGFMNHTPPCCSCEGCNYSSDNYWFPILTHVQVDGLGSVGDDTRRSAAEVGLKFLKISLLCRYFIDRHTDLERQFNINVDDGKITLAKLLDRETDMWHNITVTATEVSKSLLLPRPDMGAAGTQLPKAWKNKTEQRLWQMHHPWKQQ